MTNNKSQDRHAAEAEELHTYEPPQLVVLGSLPQLTGGGFGGTPEPTGASAD